MTLRDLPIKRKLRRVFLLTSCAVLCLTCTAYFVYDYLTFRHTTVGQLSTLGKVIASNSTAALAFYDADAAKEILSAIYADQHIVSVALFDDKGKIFALYPEGSDEEVLENYEIQSGYYFHDSHLLGFEPVVQGERRLGTLFLKSDTRAIYDRLLLYMLIAAAVIALSLLLAYFVSERLQREISTPIVQLAETAKAVSDRQDYSVRATKLGSDEIGSLTDAFNHMLARIEEQTEEITSFNQRLEQRVVERTMELQAANKELEAFSYSVSHDLRAPLRSIHGYMKIFSEEYMQQLDSEGRRLVNIILSNGARMGQLIDDLLSFSQLGRKDLRKSRVQMKNLVNEVWTEQLESEKDRNIKFILHDIPPAIADAVTMRQVWANLISNACKYTMNRDEAVIEVGSYMQDKTVVYFVKDNGAGFEMKYYNKLFGVFQRLHSEEEFSGTGVGLAIVERVIAKHGGAVWAESKVNEGTTFFFTLERTSAAPNPALNSNNQ